VITIANGAFKRFPWEFAKVLKANKNLRTCTRWETWFDGETGSRIGEDRQWLKCN